MSEIYGYHILGALNAGGYIPYSNAETLQILKENPELAESYNANKGRISSMNDLVLIGSTISISKLPAEEINKNPELTGSKSTSVEKQNNTNWGMPRGSATINGREYSQHALERMAPDTPQVRAELAIRANALAKTKGFLPGSEEYYKFVTDYVQPRNIPPMVIEDAVKNGIRTMGNTPGTYVYKTNDVTVITNTTGKVITVIPK
jgi:hypothetical protein